MARKDEVHDFVERKIEYISSSPDRNSMLAKLRRGLGKEPYEEPGCFEIVFSGIPPSLVGKSDDIGTLSDEEKAIYTALTLCALHMQGNDWQGKSDQSFATAVRSLIPAGEENEESINRFKRRFDATITSTDLKELSSHARGLVQLMRSSDKPVYFDYPRFASDLYELQKPYGRGRVRTRWGLDFYRAKPISDDNKE